MLILTNEQAFLLMNQKFAALARADVIDLCHDDQRYPALVVHVDHDHRFFIAVPLTKDNVDKLTLGLREAWKIPARFGGPSTVTVRLPGNPEDRRPAWNVLEVQPKGAPRA